MGLRRSERPSRENQFLRRRRSSETKSMGYISISILEVSALATIYLYRLWVLDNSLYQITFFISYNWYSPSSIIIPYSKYFFTFYYYFYNLLRMLSYKSYSNSDTRWPPSIWPVSPLHLFMNIPALKYWCVSGINSLYTVTWPVWCA